MGLIHRTLISLLKDDRAHVCPRPVADSVVQEPEDVRSQNGVLEAKPTVHNVANPDGTLRYCYFDGAGRESPNLRVNPATS